MPLQKTRTTSLKRRKVPFANAYWFPLAAFYAALALPWSVAGQFGWLPAPPGLQHAWGHGHEMLFGFALAVVAGYVLGPQPPRKTAILVAIWLAARLTFLLWPASWVSGLFNVLFIGFIARHVVPIYLRTAKKWRNKAVAFIAIGLTATVGGFHLVLAIDDAQLMAQQLLLEGILLLSALMFFMGGRMLSPAIAGCLKQQGMRLEHRVQPRIEGAVLILLAVVMLANLWPVVWLHWLTALLLLGCAGLTMMRLWRWQIIRCRRRADIVALLAGYSWLVVGWLMVALSMLLPDLRLTLALHAITIGALGTLTLSVMARTRMHRCLKAPNALPAFYGLVGVMAVIALLRMAVGWLPFKASLLWAAGLWSGCYLALLVLLIYLAFVEKARTKAA